MSAAAVVVEFEGVPVGQLRRELASQVRGLLFASTGEEALRLLKRGAGLLICPLLLSTGPCHELVAEAKRLHRPRVVVASEQWSADSVLSLASCGVDGLVDMPLMPGSLARCVAEVRAGRGLLARALEAQVGIETPTDLQRRVRQVMCRRSLEVSAGNKTAAARLLGVHRRWVQLMVEPDV
jgi:DNA-binding NarL/FixJ family response regulator